MEIVLSVIILILTVILTISEVFAKKSSDMFMNVVISVIVFGISIYSFAKTKFDFSTTVNLVQNILYILTCIAGIVDVVFYVRNYKLYKPANQTPAVTKDAESVVSTPSVDATQVDATQGSTTAPTEPETTKEEDSLTQTTKEDENK